MQPNSHRRRQAEFLLNAGGLPLLFSALERHNTSYSVVIGALSAINHIGGAKEKEIEDVFNTFLSYHLGGSFRTIVNAERAMARMYPGDFHVKREVYYIRMRLRWFRLRVVTQCRGTRVRVRVRV